MAECRLCQKIAPGFDPVRSQPVEALRRRLHADLELPMDEGYAALLKRLIREQGHKRHRRHSLQCSWDLAMETSGQLRFLGSYTYLHQQKKSDDGLILKGLICVHLCHLRISG